MPWHKQTRGDEICVTDKSGKQLHCYPNTPAGEKRADKYIAALYANAGEEVKEVGEGVFIEKEKDGRYRIIAVSTAQLKDRDGETFDVGAMDYDIATAETTGEYPEFRVFHRKNLGIGKVEKMRRVGIFAVDEGHSYTDPFSLQVCEKMLSNNDGKWRVSRGFYALEVSGGCPHCNENLLIEKQNMVVGFLCPTCKTYHPQYKGVLKDVHFRKTRTFDVSVTDVPCVPYTGVTAMKDLPTTDLEDDMALTKKDLEKKLRDAGVSKEAIDERLGSLTDAQLKEFSDIPFAQVLKEMDVETPESDEPEAVDLDEMLKEIAAIVRKEVEEAVEEKLRTVLDGLELNVPDIEIPEMKELAKIVELAAEITELKEAVEALARTDQERLKELMSDMPRNGKLRVARFKAKKPPMEDEEEDEEDEESEEEMPMALRKKQHDAGMRIIGADGFSAASMTEFISGGK